MSLYDEIGPLQAMHYIGFIAAKIAATPASRFDARATADQLLPVLHPEVRDGAWVRPFADLVYAAQQGQTDEAALRLLAYGPEVAA